VAGCFVFLLINIWGNSSRRKKEILKAENDALELLNKLKRNQYEMGRKKVIVKSKLERAAKIAEQQQLMMAQIDMPSKNALHSRWKNDLIHNVKELEKDKIAILRSILTEDGFDPTIITNDETGQKRELLLSQLIKNYDAAPPLDDENDMLSDTNKKTEQAPPKPVNVAVLPGGKDDKEPVVQSVAKLTLIKGGKYEEGKK